ncbi:MAG: hypothetical protein WCE87_07670 [Candidatus Udaeobacter sp.]
MKPPTILFTSSAAACAALLLFACSTTQTSTQNRESLLAASGFKVITPKTTAPQQKLQNLPPGKVTMVQKAGKTYYIFPDPAHNQAYVGGPKQYRQYQQLRADNKLAKESLESAEMYQDASMQWSVWGGWDAGLGSYGPMAGPGSY